MMIVSGREINPARIAVIILLFGCLFLGGSFFGFDRAALFTGHQDLLV